MRYRLRTPLIILMLAGCVGIAVLCALPYAKPLANTAADWVVLRVARAVYRDAGCGLMLE